MNLGIIGCGAVVELSHGPVLRAMVAAGKATVAVLVDPNPERRARLLRYFPRARGVSTVADLNAGEVEAALIASPVRFHAEQAIALLRSGSHVLCEKPLAASVAEAEAMAEAADKSGRVLAVGHFRRFLPVMETLAHVVKTGTFGALREFEVEEGGPFSWPAATASFFDPAQAGGGVLLDVGVHVLDLLGWWLGEPASWEYADDAEGGLEAVCRLRVGYSSTTSETAGGSVLLSRDWKTRNRWRLEFDRATVVWRVGDASRLEVTPRGGAHRLSAQLENLAAPGRPAAGGYPQAFARQMEDFLDAAAQGRAPRVSARDALHSLRWIERCYRERRPLEGAQV